MRIKIKIKKIVPKMLFNKNKCKLINNINIHKFKIK